MSECMPYIDSPFFSLSVSILSCLVVILSSCSLFSLSIDSISHCPFLRESSISVREDYRFGGGGGNVHLEVVDKLESRPLLFMLRQHFLSYRPFHSVFL